MTSFEQYYKLYDDLVIQKVPHTILEYAGHTGKYTYKPYSHSCDVNALDKLYNLIIDNIVFYSFSENEIIKHHSDFGLLDNLREAAVYAILQRLPERTDANSDGLFGEVLLDLLIQIYAPKCQKMLARAKYTEMRKKSEVTGYDAMYFTKAQNEICLWLGQAKAGREDGCRREIKEDLKDKYIEPYFSDSAFYIADRTDCKELCDITNTLNRICLDVSRKVITESEKSKAMIDYFKKINLRVKIPCLLAYTKDIYMDKSKLEEQIAIDLERYKKSFEKLSFNITFGLPYDIIFYLFPVKDVSYIRNKIVDFKSEVFTT